MVSRKVVLEPEVLLVDPHVGLREPARLQDQHAQGTGFAHHLLYVQLLSL